jgi:hypothetical protein
MSKLRTDVGVCFDTDLERFQPCQPISDDETSAKSLITLTKCNIQHLEELTAVRLFNRQT